MLTRGTDSGKINLNKKWCFTRECESLKGKDRIILCNRDAVWLLLFQNKLILPHCQKGKQCSYCSASGVHWAAVHPPG